MTFDYKAHKNELTTIVRNLRVMEVLIRRQISDEYSQDIEGCVIAVRRQLPSLTGVCDEEKNLHFLQRILATLNLDMQLNFAAGRLQPQALHGATLMAGRDLVRRDVSDLIWMLGFAGVDRKYVRTLVQDILLVLRIHGCKGGRLVELLQQIHQADNAANLRWKLILVQQNDNL